VAGDPCRSAASIVGGLGPATVGTDPGDGGAEDGDRRGTACSLPAVREPSPPVLTTPRVNRPRTTPAAIVTISILLR
jgi:hypothetical protein